MVCVNAMEVVTGSTAPNIGIHFTVLILWSDQCSNKHYQDNIVSLCNDERASTISGDGHRNNKNEEARKETT